MDFRKSFSKPFKKLKSKLPGGNPKRDGGSGSEGGSKGRRDNLEGSEVSQRSSYLRSEVSIGDVVEGGPSAEGSNIDSKKVTLVDVDPPTSVPSISHIGEPDGM